MRLDPNPLFRRIIPPWYDSNTLCLLLLIAMVLVAVFAIIGLAVASGVTDADGHIWWMPLTLLILSLYVILSITIRLIRRYVNF